MKTLFVILCSAMLVCGCLGVGVKPINPFEPPTPEKPCTIYSDLGVTSGLIYTKIKNPCAAQNLLIQVAQGGVALEAYQIDQFKTWSAEARKYIKSGITASQLKLYVIKETMALNKKFGMLLFSVSGIIDIFQGDAVFDPDSVKLIMASMDDLDKKVEDMRVFF